MSQTHFAVQGLPATAGHLLDIWQVEPKTGLAFGAEGQAGGDALIT